MTYRKITVGDVQYEYVIGKTYTKIKGIGVFLNDDVGRKEYYRCECCGTPMNELYPNNPGPQVNVVTPQIIKDLIQKYIH